MLQQMPMPRFIRSRKILLPDIPPPSDGARDGLAIMVIGVLCAVAAVAAVIFVFVGL